MNPATGAVITVVEFTGISGATLGGVPTGLASDGLGHIWGTTATLGTANIPGVPMKGSIFKVDEGTGKFTSMVHFTGSSGSAPGETPVAPMVPDGNGFLWGTTGYTVYKIEIATGAFTNLLTFTGESGAVPGWGIYGSLASDGKGSFLGTTSGGGPNRSGTIFKMNAATGAYTQLATFEGYDAVGNPRGLLGMAPSSGLISDGRGLFWGTTSYGGYGHDAGTVFTVDAVTQDVSTALIFTNPLGSRPGSGLVGDGSNFLWGTTAEGGNHGLGTVYKISPANGVVIPVVHFAYGIDGPKGRNPHYQLTSDRKGFLWGSTSGNNRGVGTVFKVEAATEELTTVAEFPDTFDRTLWMPESALCQDTRGFMWGIMGGGGPNGSIYKLNPETGDVTVVVAFTGNAGPAKAVGAASGLVKDGMGWLWGTTRGTGGPYLGSVFKVHENTHEFVTVAEFTGVSGNVRGSYPCEGVTPDGTGFIWGITSSGEGRPTAFKIDARSGSFTSVADLAVSGPGYTHAAAPLASDGRGALWGAVQFYDLRGGPSGLGSVFKVTLGGVVTEVHRMSGVGGSTPGQIPGSGALWLHHDGSLYGATDWGGVTADGRAAGSGQIYRLRFVPLPTTLAADSISETSATLHGSVDPCGIEVEVAFEYSTDANLAGATTVTVGNTSDGNGLEAFSASLQGLQRGLNYFYRIRATNPATSDILRGEVLSFTTPDITRVQFASITYSVQENVGRATIKVSRTGGLDRKTTVKYSTLGFTATPFLDFLPKFGILTFQPGESERSFTVPIIADRRKESTETILLFLTHPSRGTQLGNPARAKLRILGR